MIITIYLIGVIISYYYSRYLQKKYFIYDRDWLTVFMNLLFSILSYVFIFISFILHIGKIIELKYTNTKPPKWL